ncbi:hypothetical protein M6B38_358130 [Iris pallida]|uniref:Uncharacterized protein n=1 Tax=Iris pallida TaxID=29817 RepID=A0AAX6GL82_IRIPA|nr:hypothetical protein M6B38_358130 [Iris pallida]
MGSVQYSNRSVNCPEYLIEKKKKGVPRSLEKVKQTLDFHFFYFGSNSIRKKSNFHYPFRFYSIFCLSISRNSIL